MADYKSIRTGNLLERRSGMFYWHDRWFSGLVDVEVNALYDDPEDSFMDHVTATTTHNTDLIEKVSE
ncbi:MAG: hypothetical protein QQN63_04070 [Nitrosopumilus sp.]